VSTHVFVFLLRMRRRQRRGEGSGQAWSVGMIHSSLMEAWRGRVTM
jgi:hypothetical protein